MTIITIFHHSADQERAARIAAGLKDWGLSAEPAANDASPALSDTVALILWTGYSSLDSAFLTAWAQNARARRVDLALGDVAVPALDPVRLGQWSEASTGDPSWPVLVDRVTTAAYGDPSRTRAGKTDSPAAVPAAPIPARDIAIARYPVAAPDPVVASAREEEAPAVSVDAQPPSLVRAAPWIVWGTVLFLIAVFMLSPAILETQSVGTAFPAREPGSQDFDIYLVSTVWTPLFLSPLFLWLRSAGRIGWVGTILFVGAITGVHFLATYGGHMAAMLTMKDSVLGATLFFGSLIGSACSFILLMSYRPLRRWDVLKTAMLCAAILAAAAMLPLLVQGDGRLFPLVLFPLWQVLFGLGVAYMFTRVQTSAGTDAAFNRSDLTE